MIMIVVMKKKKKKKNHSHGLNHNHNRNPDHDSNADLYVGYVQTDEYKIKFRCESTVVYRFALVLELLLVLYWNVPCWGHQL